jgi:hypothetical protein
MLFADNATAFTRGRAPGTSGARADPWRTTRPAIGAIEASPLPSRGAAPSQTQKRSPA